MKILKVILENFGSYDKLDFEFTGHGLTLIQGPTGSGKSTLCDAIPWVMFGRTSKNGTVDEVVSWPGNKVTKGKVELENGLIIVRIRGKGNNDLYYSTHKGEISRGKDLTDTQRIINSLLNMTFETYLSLAYFHEFSQTAQFFTTTPKNRRGICEQIVDLSMAIKLQEKTAAEIKKLKSEITTLNYENHTESTKLIQLKQIQESEATRALDWEAKHKLQVDHVIHQYEQFEIKKVDEVNKLHGLLAEDLRQLKEATICAECGQVKQKNLTPVSKFETQLHQKRNESNPYEKIVKQLKTEKNPYQTTVQDYSSEINELTTKTKNLENKITQGNKKLTTLENLEQTLVEFRSVLIKNTILNVEHQTNSFLQDYFDGEFRITLNIESTDKLDVEIVKQGNICSYTQMSKGQRQMLKLCFGVAIMKAASNNSGIHVNTLFFDEIADGMDDTTKLKAVRLLESLSLETENVFLVEHSETVKASIINKYNVELVNGQSQIEKI
jgi:DNA repair exonuclease SbcCD ATPase subunit